MRKLFYLITGCALALTAVSCGNSGHNSAESDSIARADSIRVADSIRIADSIAKAAADSIARIDSIARADSIAKAEAKNAEANRDKSIDRDLDYVAMVNSDLKSGGGGTAMWHEAQAAKETISKLNRKVDKMTPKQLARFNKLKKGY